MLGGRSEDVEPDEIVARQVVALLALGRCVGLAVYLRVGALVLERSLADVHPHLWIFGNYLELDECAGGVAEGADRPFVLRVDGDLVLVLIEHARGAVVGALEQLVELEVVVRYLVVPASGGGDGLQVVVEHLVHLLGTQLLLAQVHLVGVQQVVEDWGHGG